MDIQIKKWGNSIGFRIPYKVAESLKIDENSIVELTVIEDILTIKKKPAHSTLDELINSISDDFQYPDDVADFVQGEAAGRELI